MDIGREGLVRITRGSSGLSGRYFRRPASNEGISKAIIRVCLPLMMARLSWSG
jgi:hypothetical protein